MQFICRRLVCSVYVHPTRRGESEPIYGGGYTFKVTERDIFIQH
jgi:hypothetical protein